MPPGGAPPPPYDPKTQYHVYREQQKAAWRAQRDAWKAQKHAWKSGYVGAYGPRVPSVVGPTFLIGAGIVALLLVTGRLNSGVFWSWYGDWWPMLLIGAGLLLLGEWALDLRRATPVRRSGSFIGLLILLAILGGGAATFNHAGDWFNWGNNDGDFFSNWGPPQHETDQDVWDAAIPANGSLQIDNPRGDVSITGGDGPNLIVKAHQIARADSDNEAQRIYDAQKPNVTVSGSTVVLKSAGHDRGWLGLTVVVPKNARVTVNAGHGDLTAAGLGAGLGAMVRGDVRLNSITGQVDVRFTNGRHDFTAHDVQGNLSLGGDTGDLTISQIKGTVMQSGEISGDVHIEDVSGQVRLRTNVTDVDLASLPGDLSLNNDELSVDEAKGDVHIKTRSKKDVSLNGIYGNSWVENREGNISVAPAGNFSVQAVNSHGNGNVEVTLGPNASAMIDGRTRNGDILDDFSLAISGNEAKTVQGRISGGAARIVLTTDVGDVRIKRGPGFPATPQTALSPAASATPAAPNAPHLKSKKQLPAKPVTQ
jgi:DUF4097 and DUF4098 domain-containing protein YvlB